MMAPKLDALAYPFKLCIRLTKWFPVLFITVIISWSYYAYVIQLNLFTIQSYAQKALYLLFYHILLVMFLWSFWKTVFTEVGRAPKQFRLPSSQLEMYLTAETDDTRKETLERFIQQNNLPVSTRTLTGDIRYCDKCAQIKPDRCHHCMVCGECVLKMDHHCPWVNNCVSFTNYKFFVLFLGYGLAYCLFIAATSVQYFIKFWTNQLTTGSGKFHILFLFFVAIMFAISLLSLFGYHIFLISRNRSTVESFRAPIFKISLQSWVQDKEGFSLGFKNNFIEVFGEERSSWFLPRFSSLGDGVNYSMRSSVSHNMSSPTCSAQAMSYGSTNNSLGDGVTHPQLCVNEDTDGLLSSRQRWAENEFANGHLNTSVNDELQEVITSSHTNPV